MARIEFVDLAHSYAKPRISESANWALQPMNVVWNDGGAYALLGPSGCGKTTLLNIVSGLITPTMGKVLFDGRDITSLSPEQRNIAQVFQFPVIYDTMTVFDNLAFPLRNRKWKEPDVRKRVQEIAELLELSGDLKFRASGLSADAKQKISLGRGLVRPDVAAILFDEPLTVIDPHLKWLLRRKLKQIHQQLKLTLIYVTHDQVEALTFADTVVVMAKGEIVQSGTAQELFETPEHAFVGHFIGSPGMNFLPCQITTARQSPTATVGGHSFELSTKAEIPLNTNVKYQLGIRPDFIVCENVPSAGAIPITIESSKSIGTHWMTKAKVGNHPIWIKSRGDLNLRDSNAWMRVPKERVMLYANERRVK